MQGILRLIFCSVTILPGLLQAATLQLADLQPGDLLISEYLADPIGLPDADGEYFEIYNSRHQAVDLTGLVVQDDGSNRFAVSALTVAPQSLAVFSKSDGTSLGIRPDYVYGSAMSLGNADDEIVLVGAGGTVLQRLSYTAGNAFGPGVAHELARLLPGVATSQGPQTGNDYLAATAPLPAGNFGSPGRLGNSLPAVPLPPAAWMFAGALCLLGRWRHRRPGHWR